MRAYRLIERVHLWLGLLLGLQVLLWMASGVVMSFFDIRLVRGETSAATRYAVELDARSYANPGGAIAQSTGATEVRLRDFLGRAVYEVRGADGIVLFDAQSGEKISPLAERDIRAVATRDFIGEGDISRAALLTETPGEYRGPLPVWQIQFTDDLETRLYISPDTGAVLARRNKIWRLYDFFWMLHIMDYGEREDFNNPLLKTAAATGLFFALTGVVLVVWRLRTPRYWVGGGLKNGPKKPVEPPSA